MTSAILALLLASAAPALGADVTYFPADKVATAFAKCAVLFDGAGRNYMVHASRREAAGQAEVHTRDTHIIYVLEGATTFVTGGLPYSGVFRVADGKVRLLTTDLTGPNGLALSPDEKFFYVDDWDVKKKVVMRYRVEPEGTLSHGEVFFDMTSEPGEQALDGMKVDQQGNLYVSGPGGVWIISPAAKHLGTIKAPELPANFAWGDEDGRALYMTARTGLYRIRLKIPGIRP